MKDIFTSKVNPKVRSNQINFLFKGIIQPNIEQ